MPSGGKRTGAGKKQPPQTPADILAKVRDKGLEELDRLYEDMRQASQGLKLLVCPLVKKPKDAVRVDELVVAVKDLVDGEYVLERDASGAPVLYEVWQKPADLPMQKFLYEQLAGRAAIAAQQKIDPVINVIFPDIACDPSYSQEYQAVVSRTSVSEELERPTHPQLPPIGLPD